jgi:hypothetical protein
MTFTAVYFIIATTDLTFESEGKCIITSATLPPSGSNSQQHAHPSALSQLSASLNGTQHSLSPCVCLSHTHNRTHAHFTSMHAHKLTRMHTCTQMHTQIHTYSLIITIPSSQNVVSPILSLSLSAIICASPLLRLIPNNCYFNSITTWKINV